MANEPIESAVLTAPATVAPAAEVAPSPDSGPINTFLDGPPPAAEPEITINDPAPTAEPAPVTEPVKTDAPVEPAQAPTTEGNKPLEVKTDEGDKSAEPAPLPVYEPWTLPEGTKLDEQQSQEFNSLLAELQTNTKAEQEIVQKFGQTLVDKHVAAVNETVGRLHEAYTHAWQNQTDGWRETFVKDPEIGGKRQETTVRLANEFIDTHGGTPDQKAAFRDVMRQTGLGVHPEVLRLLSNAMNNYREGSPLPANPPRSAPSSRPQRWYGKKTG